MVEKFKIGSEAAAPACKALGESEAKKRFQKDWETAKLVGKVTGKDGRSRLVAFPDVENPVKVAVRLLSSVRIDANGSRVVEERKKKKVETQLPSVLDPSEDVEGSLYETESSRSLSSVHVTSSEEASESSLSEKARRKENTRRMRPRRKKRRMQSSFSDSTLDIQHGSSRNTIRPSQEQDIDSAPPSQVTSFESQQALEIRDNSQRMEAEESQGQGEDTARAGESVTGNSGIRAPSNSSLRSNSNRSGNEQQVGSSSGSMSSTSQTHRFIIHDVLWTVQGRAIDTRSHNQRKARLSEDGWKNGGSVLDLFRQFFLRDVALNNMIKYTNQRLVRRSASPLRGVEELFTFIGLLLRLSSFSGVSRNTLWNEGDAPFIQDLGFRQFMSLDRFNKIFSCIGFVDIDQDPRTNPQVPSQKSMQLENGETVYYRTWDTVQPLIDGFNASAQAAIDPGEGLCLDECMSKWRGKDEMYNDGMPHVQKIARKPEPIGAEIVAVACTESNVLLNISLVDSKFAPSSDETSIASGASWLLKMTRPWSGSGRTVYGDSTFASVEGAVKLKKENGLYFIGVVKTATRRFPKQFINDFSYESKGSFVSLKATFEGEEVFATGWTDTTTKGFISTCGTTLPGEPRKRIKYASSGNSSVPGELEVIPRNKTVAEYLDEAPTIDFHNRVRQGYLALERTVSTNFWVGRIFTTVLGMSVTNAYMAYKFKNSEDLPFSEFRRELISQLVKFNGVSEPDRELQVADHAHNVMSIKRFFDGLSPEHRLKEDGTPRGSLSFKCKDCRARRKTRAALARRFCASCSNIPDEPPILARHIHALCSSCWGTHKRYGKPSLS